MIAEDRHMPVHRVLMFRFAHTPHSAPQTFKHFTQMSNSQKAVSTRRVRDIEPTPAHVAPQMYRRRRFVPTADKGEGRGGGAAFSIHQPASPNPCTCVVVIDAKHDVSDDVLTICLVERSILWASTTSWGDIQRGGVVRNAIGRAAGAAEGQSRRGRA